MVRTLMVALAALAWILASPAAAKSHLFDDGAPPLKIVLTAALPDLVRNDRTNPKPYPATLTVTDGDTSAETLAIQLSARGLTRRTAGFCSFPPLLLSFDKAARGALFKGQKKLKLVTYCRTPPDYEQRIVLEYLAYKLYNLMTPMSFKVRAAEVTYRTGESDPGLTRFGYLIEDVKDLADRNDRDKLALTTHQISARQLDPHAAARAALFEFMVSNLDWEFLAAPPGVECCHNARLLAAHDATPATASAVAPVPYDFDFSGLVDSPYASTPAALPVESVTERYYRGYCVSNGEVASVVQEYQARRADMMAVINGEPRLNAEFRSRALKFLDGFFAILDDPERVQRQIIAHCR